MRTLIVVVISLVVFLAAFQTASGNAFFAHLFFIMIYTNSGVLMIIAALVIMAGGAVAWMRGAQW